MTKRRIVSLGGIMGCYSCFAHVCWEWCYYVIDDSFKYAYIIMTYLLCSFTISYIDLWLYDTYVGDYAMIMLLSLILMSYVY